MSSTYSSAYTSERFWQENREEVNRRVSNCRYYLLQLIRTSDPRLATVSSLEQLMKLSPELVLERAVAEQHHEAHLDGLLNKKTESNRLASDLLESELRWRVSCLRRDGSLVALLKDLDLCPMPLPDPNNNDDSSGTAF